MDDLKKAYAAVELLKTLNLPVSKEQLEGIKELESKFIKDNLIPDVQEIVEGHIIPELGTFELKVVYQPGTGVSVIQVLDKVSAPITPRANSAEKKGTHDTTQFSFDGGVRYFKKKYFVYEVVKDYIKRHPYVTYDDLGRVFPSHIHGAANGVVRKWEDVQRRMIEHPDLENRFFSAPEYRITLADGTVIVVNDQWGAKFPNFLRYAKRMYDIKATGPYEGL